ncbi:MAG TPA: peptidoglycan DD-metalloendopeptidase family protein [Steroidobacteraceae bacterium]|jgi:septal ring factor EnvC (AmiA/AmiB activator)|nr:peptidoglycan DD-metalloendopeptidase family protein [Steroidobacteraceae bacterium]
MFRSLGACAALTALLCANGWCAAVEPTDAAHADAAKARLAAVRARIAELTNRIGIDLKQRDAMSARVREAELVIAAKRQHLDELHTSELAAERRRSELRAEQGRAQNLLQSQQASLAAQLREAYMIGRQDELKLLLNQSDPAGLGRTLTYYGYFAQQRSAKIETIRIEQARLSLLVAQIEQQTQKLQGLEEDANREIAGLQRARAERSEAVAALTKKLASGNQQLGDLKREEQAVESLVAELARVMQDFPVDATQSFAAMRGRLPWPVLGRVSARYNAARDGNAGGVRWNGVMIDAARGAKVRAPFFGRVVYADWLQGLGLLLIIGHSGGYMTLYGHAEVLYKSVGDWVAPGDVIAALNDGAGAEPQLYFEIREGRKTVDPKAWLRTIP